MSGRPSTRYEGISPTGCWLQQLPWLDYLRQIIAGKRVHPMRCLLCRGEMILIDVVRDENMMVPGFEHHSYRCSACNDVERRFVFNKQRSEHETEAPPILPAPPISPASAIKTERTPAQGFLRRGLAKIRGHLRAVVPAFSDRDMREHRAFEEPIRKGEAESARRGLKRTLAPASDPMAELDQLLRDWTVSKSNRS